MSALGPKSGHLQRKTPCPLLPYSGHMIMSVSAILNDFAEHVLALRALKGAFIVIWTIGFDPR